MAEELEEAKGVIRRRKSRKGRNAMVKRKMTKGQTMIYKTRYRKLKI